MCVHCAPSPSVSAQRGAGCVSQRPSSSRFVTRALQTVGNSMSLVRAIFLRFNKVSIAIITEKWTAKDIELARACFKVLRDTEIDAGASDDAVAAAWTAAITNHSEGKDVVCRMLEWCVAASHWCRPHVACPIVL